MKKNLFANTRSIGDKMFVSINRRVFELDSIGLEVWEKVNGENTVEKISEEIAKKHSVEYGIVLKDVSDFVKDMKSYELIV